MVSRLILWFRHKDACVRRSTTAFSLSPSCAARSESLQYRSLQQECITRLFPSHQRAPHHVNSHHQHIITTANETKPGPRTCAPITTLPSYRHCAHQQDHSAKHARQASKNRAAPRVRPRALHTLFSRWPQPATSAPTALPCALVEGRAVDRKNIARRSAACERPILSTAMASLAGTTQDRRVVRETAARQRQRRRRRQLRHRQRAG